MTTSETTEGFRQLGITELQMQDDSQLTTILDTQIQIQIQITNTDYRLRITNAGRFNADHNLDTAPLFLWIGGGLKT